LTARRAVPVLLAAGVLVTGCGQSNRIPDEGTFWADTVDGRRIPCVAVWRGGLSCDWSAQAIPGGGAS